MTPIDISKAYFQRLTVCAYHVYIATFLNLELENLCLDEAPNATEWLRKRSLEMCLENTALSLVADEYE